MFPQKPNLSLLLESFVSFLKYFRYIIYFYASSSSLFATSQLFPVSLLLKNIYFFK